MSCRDPNGAHQIAPLAAEAARRGWPVAIVADDPALAMLRSQGIAAMEAGIGAVNTDDAAAHTEARRRAAEIIGRCRPQAVIASSSGPGAGIDEALVAEFGAAGSFVLQDSWGDVNDSFGGGPGHYFVLDEVAARLTEKRAKARVVVSGMPKYDAYASFDGDAYRRDMRAHIGANEADTVFAFFGQPLAQVPGYDALIGFVVDTIAATQSEALLVLRPHPKEQPATMNAALRHAESLGLKSRIVQDGSVEALIAGADIVLSPFSTCCYDAVVLNALARKPLATPLYVLTDPIWQIYRSWTRLPLIPPVKAEAALLARTGSELVARIRDALDPACRETLWRRARLSVPQPGGASARILDCVSASLRGAGTEMRDVTV